MVGAINLDLTATTRRMPAPGETVADGVLSQQPGGKGANQAIAAARLGASVRMLGAVGDDANGALLRGALAAGGVDVRGVQTVAGATGIALITVDAEGENCIVVCPGVNSAIETEAVRVHAHTAVLAQLEVPLEVVSHVSELTDGFFALNLSPARDIPEVLWQRVDLFIVNEDEYAAAPRLRNARLVAVTLGARGAILYRHGTQIASAHVPATLVVNTVGAGDSFAAALTVGLLRGDPPQDALHRACAVGAAAVGDPRSQPELRDLSDYPAR
ncbi:ribokinase [Microbacterium hominis]|uniref:ribokinase n=1 Tax=Microbacterium hominis TaxID=162426 RepID=UPI00349F2358